MLWQIIFLTLWLLSVCSYTLNRVYVHVLQKEPFIYPQGGGNYIIKHWRYLFKTRMGVKDIFEKVSVIFLWFLTKVISLQPLDSVNPGIWHSTSWVVQWKCFRFILFETDKGQSCFFHVSLTRSIGKTCENGRELSLDKNSFSQDPRGWASVHFTVRISKRDRYLKRSTWMYCSSIHSMFSL